MDPEDTKASSTTESSIIFTPAPTSLEVNTGCTVIKLTPQESVPTIEVHGIVVTYDSSAGMLTITGDAKVTYEVDDGVLKLTLLPTRTVLNNAMAKLALDGMSSILGSRRSGLGGLFGDPLPDYSDYGPGRKSSMW
ncbi:MAG TPA: hypothetical protein VN778_00290 [Verrucomicrobiae bacterium]|nr:hypothetical protein [Verrucomicrobiae bacterium]